MLASHKLRAFLVHPRTLWVLGLTLCLSAAPAGFFGSMVDVPPLVFGSFVLTNPSPFILVALWVGGVVLLVCANQRRLRQERRGLLPERHGAMVAFTALITMGVVFITAFASLWGFVISVAVSGNAYFS